jgi:hypothetical protein
MLPFLKKKRDGGGVMGPVPVKYVSNEPSRYAGTLDEPHQEDESALEMVAGEFIDAMKDRDPEALYETVVAFMMVLNHAEGAQDAINPRQE